VAGDVVTGCDVGTLLGRGTLYAKHQTGFEGFRRMLQRIISFADELILYWS
jgi:hypothetical protein